MLEWKGYALAGGGVAALAAAVVLAWSLHGSARYRAGYAQAQIDAAIAAAALTQEMQNERDRADAQYRGAVLAREAAQRDLVSVRARLDRVLLTHGRNAKDPDTSRRSDDPGADWIGGFGACYAEYADLAGDAAGWADRLNGLQGYVRAILPEGAK